MFDNLKEKIGNFVEGVENKLDADKAQGTAAPAPDNAATATAATAGATDAGEAGKSDSGGETVNSLVPGEAPNTPPAPVASATSAPAPTSPGMPATSPASAAAEHAAPKEAFFSRDLAAVVEDDVAAVKTYLHEVKNAVENYKGDLITRVTAAAAAASISGNGDKAFALNNLENALVAFRNGLPAAIAALSDDALIADLKYLQENL